MHAASAGLARAHPLDDAELITRFLAGERECFALLVRRHAPPLWATLRRSVRDAEEARDVYQETWLRAFERIGTLRDAGRLRSWLLSIGLNLVRQGRRRRIEEEPERPVVLEAAGSGEGDAAEAAEAQDELALLRRRIAGLPPRQREVLDLRMNHGSTHAEVALLLGITEESSRANYYQALRKLRAEYERWDGGPR